MKNTREFPTTDLNFDPKDKKELYHKTQLAHDSFKASNWEIKESLNKEIGKISKYTLWFVWWISLAIFLLGISIVIYKLFLNPDFVILPFFNFVYNFFGVGAVSGIASAIFLPLYKHLRNSGI